MARAALQHPGYERAGELHRRAQVDVDRAIDLVGGEVIHPAGGGQAGVGYEDVDVARLGRQRRRAVRR